MHISSAIFKYFLGGDPPHTPPVGGRYPLPHSPPLAAWRLESALFVMCTLPFLNPGWSTEELWFLYSARRLMILNICMKFQEDIFNGFHVKHSYDFVTELLLTKFKGV